MSEAASEDLDGRRRADILAQLRSRMHLDDQEHQAPPEIVSAASSLKRHTRLGEGGLGVVYEYFDEAVERHVALKVERRECLDSRDKQRRFIREYTLTSQLQHPAIPPVYGVGQLDDGRSYYVMRLAQGKSLLDHIENAHKTGAFRLVRGCPELESLLSAFLVVCGGIQYAHDRGVIHRDLKPSNVMLESDGAAFVVDWGLARKLNDMESDVALLQQRSRAANQETTDNVAVGTIAWMSPEQATGNVARHGRHTDVYGLGAILFNILTGSAPHTWPSRIRNHTPDVWAELIVDNPTRDDVLNHARVPSELCSICRRAMAGEPEDRYESAAALRTDVECWLRRERVQAHRGRYTPLERIGHFAVRHYRGSTVFVMLLLIVLFALGVVTFLITRSRQREAASLWREQQVTASLFGTVERMSQLVLDETAFQHPALEPHREEILSEIVSKYTLYADADATRPNELWRAARGLAMVARVHSDSGNHTQSLAICTFVDRLWNRIDTDTDQLRFSEAEFRQFYASRLLVFHELDAGRQQAQKALELVEQCIPCEERTRHERAIREILNRVQLLQAVDVLQQHDR